MTTVADADADDEQVWYSTAAAAPLLGYKTSDSVRRMIISGEIKARRRGRSWRVPRSEIERLSKAPV